MNPHDGEIVHDMTLAAAIDVATELLNPDTLVTLIDLVLTKRGTMLRV